MPQPEPTPSPVSAAVHVLGGLPTDGVRRGFERISESMEVRSFAEFVGSSADGRTPVGVLLPPWIETAQLVEDWEACDYVATRLGDGARIGNVVTVVDAERVGEQLASVDPISAHGWGKSARDVRTVADIAVGQIESATHLALAGDASRCESVRPLLGVLNPSAACLALDETSHTDLSEFVMGVLRPAGQSDDAFSARIVPPWLGLLQAESTPPCASNRFLYRRARPFDPGRFGEWLAQAPRELVRAKGNVWLADRWDQSFGYSCAGSVHRLFAAGRWWASLGGSAWPSHESERRRLLERWHPRFGDRRQEIAFVGIEHDRHAICAGLDACLLSEEEALDVVPAGSTRADPGSCLPQGAAFH